MAQQELGNQASSAAIERDFSGAVDLSGRRRRMDDYYVEMMIFLYLNFRRIPVVGFILEIPPSKILGKAQL